MLLFELDKPHRGWTYVYFGFDGQTSSQSETTTVIGDLFACNFRILERERSRDCDAALEQSLLHPPRAREMFVRTILWSGDVSLFQALWARFYLTVIT